MENPRGFLKRTCFEITSGDRGVNFEGSISTFGMISSSSDPESESKSDSTILRVSSPGIFSRMSLDSCLQDVVVTRSL